jgi:hypothetical protein
MHVVLLHVALHDLYVRFPTHLSDEFPNPNPYFSTQDALTVFRRPHQVQVDLEYRVRTVSVAHTAYTTSPQPLLKLSPEGEGFDPPKR